jgi:hypothetical protein
MRWTVLVFVLPLTACLQLSTGDGTGSSGGGDTSGSSGSTTSSSKGGATSGTNCTTDPQSGITLCEQIANCPGVDVDQGAFPGCGFRLHASSVYDLECACSGMLCPIGAATSCSSAEQLLGQSSSLVVCEQVDNGTCLPMEGDGGASTSSACDKNCESQCAGDPNCIQMCGC